MAAENVTAATPEPAATPQDEVSPNAPLQAEVSPAAPLDTEASDGGQQRVPHRVRNSRKADVWFSYGNLSTHPTPSTNRKPQTNPETSTDLKL